MLSCLGGCTSVYCQHNKLPQTQRLETTQVIIFLFCRSEVKHRSHWARNQGVWQDCFPFQRFQGKMHSLAFFNFQMPPAFLPSVAHGLLLPSKAATEVHAFITLHLSNYSWEGCSTFKDSYNSFAPSQIIRINLFKVCTLVHICKVPFPIKVTYLQVSKNQGVGTFDHYPA